MGFDRKGPRHTTGKANKIFFVLLAAFLSTLNYQPSTLFAQGSLTPPGAPAPTMKTLDQIEARTPISSAPFTISLSGSYYLTKNLTVSGGNAITIAASAVTLDLNGFTISSTASSATGNAILLNSSLHNITIRDGFIESGVVYSGGNYNVTYVDNTTINLPFGRGALVGIEPIFVPPDADPETMERIRVQLEINLNEATRRAYEQVGRSEASIG